ncbi:MAG: glutathione S-transferase family protein [Pseudomonadales bacterium]|nr:glutathione S-transferase family protein [Pseudomonadales bacterium]
MNVQKVMWALGEMGISYERKDVAGSFGLPEAYTRINPNGVVPGIVDGDLTLWESNACVRYLARTYGQGTLWPTDGIALAHADQWMDWASSSVNPPFFQIFMNMIRLPADKADTTQIEAGVRNCARVLMILDTHLAHRRYVAGDALTMGDIPLGAMMYRYFTLDISRPSLPNVERWYEHLVERDAYRKHVMIPFGHNADQWLVEEQKNAGIQ